MDLVVFHPSGKKAQVDGRQSLLQMARALDIPIQASCGGLKKCGKCRVIIEAAEGPLPLITHHEQETLGELTEQGFRLACETVLTCGAQIRIPEESLIQKPVILTADTGQSIHLRLRPAVRPFYLEVPEPVLEMITADSERFLQSLKETYGFQVEELDLRILKKLPHRLRSQKGITAFLRKKKEVLSLLPGRKETCFGMAFDIGTTTLVAYLFDLKSGERLSVRSGLNPQIAFGDDVISRISFGQTQPEGLERLHSSLLESLNRLIVEASEEAGIDSQEILETTVVGNTVMHHLFVGLDPRYLALAPFPPVVQAPQDMKARELDLGTNPLGNVHLLPLKAGFVGSDTIAGILASRLHKAKEPALFMDLGTNGEIVAGWKNRLICCSTAAGPAFEGGHIRWGMRASAGAIERVRIEPHSFQVTWKSIQNEKPAGLCGSGIISALAELIRRGIISVQGHFNKGIRTSRLRTGEDGMEFVLAWAEETVQGRDIVITRKDVAEVQMAKAAVFAGSTLLLEMLADKKIKKILLAGAFGNYVDPEDARVLGLFPDVQPVEYKVMGNTAGQGACLALLDTGKRKEAERIARKMEYLELASHTRFQELFVSGLLFRSALDFRDTY
ncbi:MAG: ferredoxin [Desulfobacca sp.]|nr:ferredoxin [Desulfobacca sp.]